jgi:DHA1 family inner membrane transport protein
LLHLLAACNLVIGTGAFALGGILVPMSQALGVSVATAGQSITAYAFATALLAPAFLLLTGRLSRKTALLIALSLFAVGNTLCAVADHMAWVFVGRVIMGAGASFTPLAAGLAVALVPAAQRGRALSATFLGMSLSYVIGLPLGAWLGFRYGWHAPVWLVTAGCGLALLALWRLVPSQVNAPGVSFAGLGPALRQGVVVQTLGSTLLYFVAIFCVFSYAGPVLQALNPMSSTWLSITLALFGLAGVAGTLSGGWAADRFGPLRTLRLQIWLLFAMMTVVPLTAGHWWLTVLAFTLWGICGFGMMTPQQSRLAGAAPQQAPMLLSLNTSMLYIGTALGAAVGGVASVPLGFAHLAWAGLPFALAAALWLTLRADKPKPADTPSA